MSTLLTSEDTLPTVNVFISHYFDFWLHWSEYVMERFNKDLFLKISLPCMYAVGPQLKRHLHENVSLNVSKSCTTY